MAGIEEAFKNFVNRVSQKEQREDKSAERGFQYGGGAIGYANGGYPPITAGISMIPGYADGGGVETLFRPKYADGGIIDPFSTSLNNAGFELKKSEDGSYQVIPSGKSIISSEGSYTLPSFYPGEYVLKDLGYGYALTPTKDIPNLQSTTTEIPKIDPFSGQQVSAQDIMDMLEQLKPPTPAAGWTEEGLLKNAEDAAAREQAAMNAFNAGLYNNIPTIDPFSGQQVSAQDQLAFTQPQQPSSTEQFIAQKQFQSEADAAARSGTPFTKTLQDYLSPVAGAAYGKSVLDAFNQIGLTPAKQMLVNEALNSPSGIARALLGEVGGGFRPTPGGVGLGEYIGQGLKSLGQAATLNTANLGVNPAVGGGTLGSRVLGNLIGGPAIFATALLNPTTMGNAELTPQMRSQQEATARVPMKMKSGGYVNTHLTTTIPPVRGPNPQGVETLFKRRYS